MLVHVRTLIIGNQKVSGSECPALFVFLVVLLCGVIFIHKPSFISSSVRCNSLAFGTCSSGSRELSQDHWLEFESEGLFCPYCALLSTSVQIWNVIPGDFEASLSLGG